MPASKGLVIAGGITLLACMGCRVNFEVYPSAGGGAAGLLPPERSIDWSLSGLPGGIPNRTAVCANVRAPPYSAKGDGFADDTSAIQTALDACAADGVVAIPSGTYHVTQPLIISKSITVRGDGPGKTVIDAYGSGSGVFQFGSGVWGDSGTPASITGGTTKGSTSITLDSVTAVQVGEYLQIDQLNEPGLAYAQGYGSKCTWCSRQNGDRAQGQIVEVTAVDALSRSVTFTPPLYWTYKQPLAPEALSFAMGLSRAGVEDLTVRSNDTGYRANYSMEGCAYCWLKNVEGDYTDGNQVDVLSSFRCEIRDSYFHDAFHHAAGETEDELFLAQKTSGTLVESNIFWRLRVGVLLGWGAAGNVVAYNYLSSMFDASVPHAAYPALAVSGAHPMFNLFEGNIGNQFSPDSAWGSSSHNVLYRNWLHGSDSACEPIVGRGTADQSQCTMQFQRVWTVAAEYQSVWTSIVGNVLGSPYFTTTHVGIYYGGGTSDVPLGGYMLAAPAPSGYTTPYILWFGWDGCCTGNTWSAAPLSTALIDGNWDWVTESVKATDPSLAGRTLPASLYRSGKPAWFGDRAWPPIDPATRPDALDATAIPAGYRFVNGAPPPPP